MILSEAHSGNILSSSKGADRYHLAEFDLNATSKSETAGLAKELVELRFVASAHVETVDHEENFRVYITTTSDGKAKVLNEFGGLKFEWMAIRGSATYMSWIDETVNVRSEEL